MLPAELRKIRETVLQFLYQNEQEKIYSYSQGQLAAFLKNFEVPEKFNDKVFGLARGIMEKRASLDQVISEHLSHWKIDRLARTDLVVLRMATYELLESETPTKVVLNEAIELAHAFGSEKSGSFVNGVLDQVAKKHRKM